MKRKRQFSSSEVLLKVANDKSLEHNLTYKNLITALEQRAFGIALLIFSLPSALPFSIIPGFSVVFSIPILIFALQMTFGKKSLWLPGFIASRHLSHEKLSKIIKMAIPYLKKIEHLLKPRWLGMNSVVAECVSGLLISLLAITLMLPIPFSNFVISIILIIFALGIVEKDGILIAIGWLAAIIALIFIPTFIVSFVKYIFQH